MDDVTLTRLFERMDSHLAQQDVSQQEILATLREQNAVLASMAQMLATTAREVAAIHAEASRGFAGAMHLLSHLVTRLEEGR